MPRPPKDGMYTRFTGAVMDEVVKLVPDFISEEKYSGEAESFYQKLRRRAKFKRMAEEHLEIPLPEHVRLSRLSYRCTSHVESHYTYLTLGGGRQNPLEVLHLVAHYLQPSDSKWHGGEFGSIFLDLVGMMFGPDTKRAAKDILLANGVKTSVRSEETRAKQSERFVARRVASVPEGLVKIMQEMRKLNE